MGHIRGLPAFHVMFCGPRNHESLPYTFMATIAVQQYYRITLKLLNLFAFSPSCRLAVLPHNLFTL